MIRTVAIAYLAFYGVYLMVMMWSGTHAANTFLANAFWFLR